MNQENNCAKVWTRIQSHLSSTDVITAHVMNLSTKLFALKCDDRDSFLAFYSQVKGLSHKLSEHNSVAVQDDVFMRAFLSKTIEAPELQSEVKKSLKEPKIKYLEVLEKVFEDYRVQETGQHLQETQAFSTAGRIACKVAHEQETKPAPTKLPPILFHFPRNSDNKIPSEIYTQVREWFKRAIKPKPDKSDADKEFLSSFSFKMHQSRKQGGPPHKGPRSGSKYDDYSRRSRRGGYRSRSPSFERDYHNHYEHDDPRRSSRRGAAYRDRS